MVVIRDSRRGFKFSQLNSFFSWAFWPQDKKINQGNYQWICDILDNMKVISTLWTLNYGDCAPFFLFFLFFPYCWQSSQIEIMIKSSFIWLLHLTLSVNFQITLVLMKSKVCVSSLIRLHKNLQQSHKLNHRVDINSIYDIKCQKLNLMQKISDNIYF